MKKITLFILILTLIGCRKEEIGPQPVIPIEPLLYYNVLVGCEGNFGSSNGSVTAYDRVNNQVSNNYFEQINNFVLGDVVQYIEEIDGEIYIVVNNSGKIEIVDSADFSSNATITGLNSPREIKKVSSDFAYVTDLFSNSIQVLNLQNKTISSSIAVSGWTESIIVRDTIAYVACPGSNLIYQLNVNNHELIDSLVVGDSPMNMLFDKNDQLWVLCAGSWGANNGSLERIEIANFSLQETISLNSSPSKLCADANGDHLFWIDGGVKKMNVDQSGIISEEVPSNGKYFYSLAVHAQSGEIFIADAVDFVQSGWLFRYNNTGVLLDSVNTGINPQALFFK